MRRKVCSAFSPAADLKNYTVTISFAGYVGSEEEFEVFASDQSSAADDALEEARDELSYSEVEQIDDDEWEVSINWAGFIGIDETYTVVADSEEDAIDQALEEAAYDLEVVDVIGD